MTPNIEHLLRLARRGYSPGSSGGEYRANQIVNNLLDGFVILDGKAQDGIAELVDLLATNNSARHEIREQLDGPSDETIFYD